MNYLPEWKIYLWKKLLLNADDISSQPINFNKLSLILHDNDRENFGRFITHQDLLYALIELARIMPNALNFNAIFFSSDYLDVYDQRTVALVPGTNSMTGTPKSRHLV